jgi:Periplasmic protease
VTLASASPGAQGDHGGLGLVVRPLNANEEQQAGVSHGLLVEGVSGPAEQAGIQPGDILIAVDGKSVKQHRSGAWHSEERGQIGGLADSAWQQPHLRAGTGRLKTFLNFLSSKQCFAGPLAPLFYARSCRELVLH